MKVDSVKNPKKMSCSSVSSESPKLSVCVPVYNCAPWIAASITSLLCQTLTQIEIIISDNASSDETWSIVLRLASSDSRIVALRNSVNVGFPKNVHVAVARARAPYVAIFHGDDIYHPEIAERELSLLSSDSTIGGVFCLPETFYGVDKPTVKNRFQKNLYRIAPYDASRLAIVGGYTDYLPLILKWGNLFACPSFITRKEVFLSLGGFTDRYRFSEDFELWIKFLKAGWKLGIVNDFLFSYRQSATQGSATERKRPQLGSMYDVLSELVVSGLVLTSVQLRDYRRNRALGYLRVSQMLAQSSKHSDSQHFARLSRSEAKLPPDSFWAIAQYFPRFASLLIRLWRGLLR